MTLVKSPALVENSRNSHHFLPQEPELDVQHTFDTIQWEVMRAIWKVDGQLVLDGRVEETN